MEDWRRAPVAPTFGEEDPSVDDGAFEQGRKYGRDR